MGSLFSAELPVQPTLFQPNHQVWSAQWITETNEVPALSCDVLGVYEASNRWVSETGQAVFKMSALQHEIDALNDAHVHEYEPKEAQLTTCFAPTEEEVWALIQSRCQMFTHHKSPSMNKQSGVFSTTDIVKEIIKTGDPSNRIDVVFMGDGYLESDQDLMDADFLRLTDEMFNDITFSSYLPVFNIWSVFRASQEQGIGVGGEPRDTAFGLYRDGTELRGIFPSKRDAARDACLGTGPDACDFPSLIGNDPFYGGLGGEFTITTSSHTSGTLVLRHEMGHNFIQVGEEYDGGSVYYGVNHSPAADDNTVTWPLWATEPEAIQLEDAVMPIQDYAWYDLAEGPYTITFSSDGNYPRWLLKYSVSGFMDEGSLNITLDGSQSIPWDSPGTMDRSLYEYFSEEGFTAGIHTLTFTAAATVSPDDPIRQLCSVTMHEWAAEPFFHADNSYIGAYPTWKSDGSMVGYRPTNELCLMRNMSSRHFCPVCQEGMWMQFFGLMSAIDAVEVHEYGEMSWVVLTAVKLAQLRPEGAAPGEAFQVRWFFQKEHVELYDDRFNITVNNDEFQGHWHVELTYITPEVRDDPNNLLTFTQSFQIAREGGALAIEIFLAVGACVMLGLGAFCYYAKVKSRKTQDYVPLDVADDSYQPPVTQPVVDYA